MGVMKERADRHREDIESVRSELRDVQRRLRKVEGDLEMSQAKVSWSGGSCWIPANCPTLT
jgi:hypothetical protein